MDGNTVIRIINAVTFLLLAIKTDKKDAANVIIKCSKYYLK